MQLQRRETDGFTWNPQTRGDSARQHHCEVFMAEPDKWDALLLLDGDQTFPDDMVDRLWSHGVDIVSGLYFRRTFPPAPVAYAASEKWPLQPLFEWKHLINDKGLVPIGATGFGCVLIKRNVFEYFDKHILKPKEPYIFNGPYPERAGHWRSYGADLRFFDRARQHGFDVWLDPNCKSGHIGHIELNEESYQVFGGWRSWGETYKQFVKSRIEGGSGMDKEVLEARRKQHLIEKDSTAVKIEQLKASLTEAEHEMVGRMFALKELDFMLEALEKEESQMIGEYQELAKCNPADMVSTKCSKCGKVLASYVNPISGHPDHPVCKCKRTLTNEEENLPIEPISETQDTAD